MCHPNTPQDFQQVFTLNKRGGKKKEKKEKKRKKRKLN
jgi:hypothetical protein